MRSLGYIFILIGVAVLFIGISEYAAALEFNKAADETFASVNLHMPGDREVETAYEKFSQIQRFRVIQSLAVSSLCFYAAFNTIRKKTKLPNNVIEQ